MSAPSKPATLWPEGLSPDRWLEWFTDLDAPARYDVAAAVLTAAQGPVSCVDQGHATVLEVEAAELAAYTKGWHDGLAELRTRLEQEWATEEVATRD